MMTRTIKLLSFRNKKIYIFRRDTKIVTRFRASFFTDCVLNENIFYVYIQRAFLGGMTTKKFIVKLFQIRRNATPTRFLRSFEKTIYFKMLN